MEHEQSLEYMMDIKTLEINLNTYEFLIKEEGAQHDKVLMSGSIYDMPSKIEDIYNIYVNTPYFAFYSFRIVKNNQVVYYDDLPLHRKFDIFKLMFNLYLYNVFMIGDFIQIRENLLKNYPTELAPFFDSKSIPHLHIIKDSITENIIHSER